MEKIYRYRDASLRLSHYIKNFWTIDRTIQTTISREKIIPDGYSELIFHSGDLFRSNFGGSWVPSDLYLLAGQIRKPYFIENIGKSKMFGIKFQPWALTELFNLDMSKFAHKRVEIPPELREVLEPVISIAIQELSFDQQVNEMENWFSKFTSNRKLNTSSGRASIKLILENKGNISLKQVRNEVGWSERSLERYFNKYVGLTPKLYLRIIRFSTVFELIEKGQNDWADVLFQTGFYDQSHFIKNFKEFAGDYPTKYKFTENSLSNNFLRKKNISFL
ncbi:MAG: helix-turn-helix domain-containing protein [Bacteroidota bacterium]